MTRILFFLALLWSCLAFAQHPPTLKQQVATNNPPTATDHAGQALSVATLTATDGVLRSVPQGTAGACAASGDYGKLIVLSTDGWGRLCTASGWLLVPMVLTNGAGTALDFGSLSAGAEETLTATITGAAAGNRVECRATAKLETGIIISNAWVSGANTVSVTLLNTTAGTVNPASATFACGVYKQ